MNETKEFMQVYDAKMEGVTIIKGGSIITSVKALDKDGRLYEFYAVQFDPWTKLWEVINDDESENFFLKAEFPVAISGKFKFQNEKGQICLPELLDVLLRTEKIYFFLDEIKYRVLAMYDHHHFIVAPDSELCNTTDSEGKETFVLMADELSFAMYEHEDE